MPDGGGPSKIIQSTWKAAPTTWAFYSDNDYFPQVRDKATGELRISKIPRPHIVRGIMGPIGSGKSVACCWALHRWMHLQKPNRMGERQTRFGVVRNTYRELEDTTMETWFEWFPQEMGHWSAKNMTHTLEMPYHDHNGQRDGTKIIAEVRFRALDKPRDVKKLLSAEYTGGWVNEARELPYPIVRMFLRRCGRYPSRKSGVKATVHGLIMDTNPPDEDHWWYEMFEEKRPPSWRLWKQPSARSRYAENIENLVDDYYSSMIETEDEAFLKVYVDGHYGFVLDGRPVYPEYNDTVHCAREPIPYNPNFPMYVGIDFGLTPAATICQQADSGQWRPIDEVVMTRGDAKELARELNQKLRKDYKDVNIEAITGDPKGEDESQADSKKAFETLAAEGIVAHPASTNDPKVRRNSVAALMKRLDFNQEPAFLLSPKCKMYRKGLMGGHKYRRIQVAGEERYHDKPQKNTAYSHVCDAGEYCAMGAGLDSEVLGGASSTNFRVKKPQVPAGFRRRHGRYVR
jgi:hypothetical protein